MGNVSYSAHISNGKSAITSKKALAGVAKHNLRKYKSADYSSDNIRLIYGTTDLFQDVKRVYHREFDDVVKEYNSRQKREDRKIKDYFEHVAGLNQDMAVEIVFPMLVPIFLVPALKNNLYRHILIKTCNMFKIILYLSVFSFLSTLIFFYHIIKFPVIYPLNILKQICCSINQPNII